MKGFFPSNVVLRDQPGSLLPKCGSCGLFKTCESPKMEPYGKGRSRVLVVGEAPGQTEDEEGRPFIGKAGQFLRTQLEALEIDLDEDAWTTNALICRPPHNATPDDRQIGYCRPNLLNAIQRFQPRVVLTLGRSALASALAPYWRDTGPLERWVGWPIPLENHWLCPTYHPSYLLRMRNPLMDRLFAEHLEQAFTIEQDPPQASDYKSAIEILYDEQEIYEAIRAINERGGWVAVDYETNCLKPEYPEARIVSCAISNGKQTIAYPWTGKAIVATGMFLRSPTTRKIASNLKFEERWTRREFGCGVTFWGWDTMLAAHCLDNRPGICSLKFQSLVKLGVPVYNENIEPYLSSGSGHYNRIGEIDIKSLLLYNGMDALLEWRLARKQRKEMGYCDD